LLKDNEDLMKENAEIKGIFESLLLQKRKLVLELNAIKDDKNEMRKSLVN